MPASPTEARTVTYMGSVLQSGYHGAPTFVCDCAEPADKGTRKAPATGVGHQRQL